MKADDGALTMSFPQAIVVGLVPDGPDGEGLRANLHGGAHVHLTPGPPADAFARGFARLGPFAVCPPPHSVCRCSS